MEGWPLSADRPPLDVGEVLVRLRSLGFLSNLESSDEESTDFGKEMRLSTFDQILIFFMKEIDQREKIPALPALLGSGRPVDLFKLYRAVSEKGGQSSVSAEGLWESVAEEIGFDSEVVPSLKLVYFKFLGNLNPLLQRVLGKKVEAEILESKDVLSSSVGESELEVKSSCKVVFDQEEDCKSTVLSGLNEGQFSTTLKAACVGVPHVHDGGDSGENRLFSSPKRKLESLSWMFNWLLRVAKSPGDPSVGSILSNEYKEGGCGVGELISLVLTARKGMFLRNIPNMIDDDSPFQKRRRIDPSVYEDKYCLHTNSDENPRTSRRILSGNKHSHSGSCSEIIKAHSDTATGAEINHAKRRLRKCNSLAESMTGFLARDPLQKRVPVGASFQVKVPEWDAKASATSQDSDHWKWLGTQIWPPERKNERRILIERDPIGKGRQESCGCEVTGSEQCVRFHVAEKRKRSKLELGSAFDDMGFDSMGEDVALSWSEDEERRFKAMVRLYRPSLDKNFWDHLYMAFPSKGIQGLVSYYYNVFLLRWRSYQNRSMGDDADTDDEERDFEFLNRPLCHDVDKVRHPESNCVQNSACVDLIDLWDSN